MNLLKNANSYPGSGQYLRSFRPGRRRCLTVMDYLRYLRVVRKNAMFSILYGCGSRKLKEFLP